MRPNGSVVIGERIIFSLARANCADAPSRKKITAQKNLCDPLGFGLSGDPRVETMAGIGRAHAARPLSAIQRQSVHGEIFTPERLLESQLQLLVLVFYRCRHI